MHGSKTRGDREDGQPERPEDANTNIELPEFWETHFSFHHLLRRILLLQSKAAKTPLKVCSTVPRVHKVSKPR